MEGGGRGSIERFVLEGFSIYVYPCAGYEFSLLMGDDGVSGGYDLILS